MGYTVWKYFKVPGKGTVEDAGTLSDRYPLYAFTKEKQMHKDFEYQRDMKKFVVSKNDMSESEFKKFANSNRNNMLEYLDYMHRNGFDDDGPSIDIIQILSTRNEKEFVEDMKDVMISDEFTTKAVSFHPFLFKKKYVKALNLLKFINFWTFSPNAISFKRLLTDEENEYVEDIDIDIDYDDLNLFIYLYGDTFLDE